MSRVLLLHGVGSSRAVWWRMERDLAELGHDVQVLDLLGHGGRTDGPAGVWTLEDLARDVVERARPVDLVVGHSLGAVTALAAVALRPDLAEAVLLEDPPGGAVLDRGVIADAVAASVAQATADPDAAIAQLLAGNPAWATLDARNTVGGRLGTAVEPVAAFLRNAKWDFPALVTECPVPVHLIVAEPPGSALFEPARATVLAALGDRVTAVASGHSIHRDRPGMWLATVLRLLG